MLRATHVYSPPCSTRTDDMLSEPTTSPRWSWCCDCWYRSWLPPADEEDECGGRSSSAPSSSHETRGGGEPLAAQRSDSGGPGCSVCSMNVDSRRGATAAGTP